MKRIGLLSIALATAVTVACNGNASRNEAPAGNPSAIGTSGDADRNSPSDDDRDFVSKISMGNAAEIELGKMASEKGLSQDVKQFGQMMVQDHTKAGASLKQAVGPFSLATPETIDQEHRDLMATLGKLNGREFDREFIDAMVDGHEHVKDTLETRVDGHGVLGRDKDTAPVAEHSDNAATMSVNAWAAATLPTVNHHFEMAKQIKDKLDRGRNSTN